MLTAGIIKVSVACPVFDGTDYPYWKNKMHMHLEAIGVDLWYVVKNGVPKAGEGVTPADVKKFIQLDSTAKNIICGHLTKGQYGRVSALETMMTHKYRGSIVVLSISKSVEPNEEQKEMISGFQ